LIYGFPTRGGQINLPQFEQLQIDGSWTTRRELRLMAICRGVSPKRTPLHLAKSANCGRLMHPLQRRNHSLCWQCASNLVYGGTTKNSVRNVAMVPSLYSMRAAQLLDLPADQLPELQQAVAFDR
jgi:hypothetical protein